MLCDLKNRALPVCMRPGGVSGGAAARADAVCSQAAEGSSFLKMVLLFCLVFGAIMASIVAKRERAERALRKVHDELERRVAERTAGLTKAHGQLKKSIEERRHHFFFKHRLASDDIREVEVFSCLIDYGKNQLLYSIVSDITERKRAEEAVRESEERYRMLFNLTAGEARKCRRESQVPGSHRSHHTGCRGGSPQDLCRLATSAAR